ncbi:MAG TPA: EAL domain-containing protein, partial [Casimicrobiaceae bacterium]
AMAWSPRKALEGVCFASLLLIVAGVVFGGDAAETAPYALAFAILPFFIWAAFRFGQREVTTAIAAICGIAVWYTLERRGPFATAPLNESLLLLLAFISTVVISGLVLSAIVGERARAMNELRRRQDEVEGLVHERTLELEETNVALALDVAARERSEKLLYESEHRFRSLTELSADWYWEQDENLRFTFLSSTVYEKSGYTATSTIGKTRWEIPDTVPLSSAWAEHRAILAARQPFRDFEYRRVGQDGPVRFISVSGEPVFDANGEFRGYRGIGRDITERKHAEERLAYLAWFDALTGLPNRHRLYDHLTQMLAQTQRTAGWIGCMIVKLDHFKDVNSIYGHRAGDQLLVEVAERLRRSARGSDTVGRLGDDEFALVLSNLTKADDAGLVAQKVIDALAPRFDLGGIETYISANIGIAIYPGDANDPEELLKNADAAMHRAKEQGRNTFRFYLPRMNERVLKRLQLDASLRGALERKEFLLYYQPKVDLATGVISGLEALLRWQHPERGRMAPAEFVPILEETGLIAPVGEWVLQTVCEQIKVWQARGITVRPVAVNLSAPQFHQADFDAQVRALITQSGVDCRLIELEITESMLMHDPVEAAGMLSRLKRIGVKLSIDDFGTGYSSLAYLKRFPLDALKIDRTFVRDVTVDSDDAAIALAIISLAHNLKLKVVAEGVETEAQMNFLRSHGCDEMQGYYFARPLSVEDCTRALIEDRCLHFPK